MKSKNDVHDRQFRMELQEGAVDPNSIPNFLAATNEEEIEAWYAENASALAVEAEFIRQHGVPGSETALVLAVAELVEEENHDLLRGLT